LDPIKLLDKTRQINVNTVDNYPVGDNLWPDELKILIVDDEQDTLNLIRLCLEPAGFRIIRTTKPEEGLDLAHREKPDLIVLDLMMPRMDGFELLRRIRRYPNLQYIPVIVVSAKANRADHLRMLKLGHPEMDKIDAYIGKPFNPAMLLRTVKQVLMTHKEFLVEKNRGHEKTRWDPQDAMIYH
jgi:CheY-like chemotaxis protein